MKIFCTLVLTLIFIIFDLSSVSAEISFNDIIDENYDFSKLKKVFIFEVDTSALEMPTKKKLSDRDKIELDKASKTYVKKMKCKLVDKELADALIKINIKTWNREYDHTVPERITYRAYEHYEGWEEFWSHPPIHHGPPPHRDGKVRHQPPPRKEKRWRISSTWFFGSHRVVTAVPNSYSREIETDQPLSANSKKIVHPPYDVYRSEVSALFEICDAKSGKLIMSREGTLARLHENQLNLHQDLYQDICKEFFKSFRKVVKQVKKAKKAKNNIKK